MTRAQILTYLETRQTATANEIARALQVTPANIRHHLGKLNADGLVTVVGERPAGGRGRPTQVYSLANQGDNVPQLASALLVMGLKHLNGEEKDTFLMSLANQMAARSSPPLGDKTKQHITQRLVETVRKLDEMNYQPRWEAHVDAPYIILEHCPFLEILDDHPELCRLDAFLIEKLLGDKVIQKAKRQINRLGTRFCLFVPSKQE